MIIKEVSKILRCGDATVHRLVKDGVLERDENGITEESVNKLTGGASHIYTVEEAAELMGVSDQTVRNYYQDGRLPGFNIRRSVRITSLLAAPEEPKVKATAKIKVPKPKTKPEPKKVEPKAKAEVKTEKRKIIKRIPIRDMELVVSISGAEDKPEGGLIKEFIKAWLEKSMLEDRIDKFIELME